MQSAGKSSLLEALSGVALPRADGTCTRGPIELRLVHSTQQWSCKIELRYEFEETTRATKPRDKPEMKPFEQINSRCEVESAVKRAQRALLNPDKPLEQFVQATESKSGEADSLKFTQ